jgi:hypothetical protein
MQQQNMHMVYRSLVYSRKSSWTHVAPASADMPDCDLKCLIIVADV